MPGTLNSQGHGGARSIRRLSLSTVVSLEITGRLTGPRRVELCPTEAGAQLAVGRMTGRLKRQSSERGPKHTEVCVTSSWATATSMALSWKRKPCVDPRADAANSLNWWLDRVWATLTPPISVALETEASIVKDRGLSEKAVDRSPQRREAKPGPGAVISPLQFVTRRHTDQDVRFRCPEGHLTGARAREPGFR